MMISNDSEFEYRNSYMMCLKLLRATIATGTQTSSSSTRTYCSRCCCHFYDEVVQAETITKQKDEALPSGSRFG